MSALSGCVFVNRVTFKHQLGHYHTALAATHLPLSCDQQDRYKLSLKHSLHALSRLSGDVDQLKHLEVGLLHVQMFVEAASFTPLRHNGHVCLGHVSHKQNDIDMPGLPVAMTETTSAAWPVFSRC